MKKIAILVATVLTLGSFSTKTLAAEANTQAAQSTDAVVSYKDEAGITPDSLLYTIDKAVDQLRLLIADSEEKKAEVITDIAEERLGESEVMAEEGKAELAKQALEEYNARITEAIKKLQEVIANLEQVTQDSSEAAVETSAEQTTQVAEKAAAEEASKETAAAEENNKVAEEALEEATKEVAEENTDNKVEQSIAELEKAIQEVQEKSLAVLDNLKNIVPKEAVDTVKEVIEEQTTHKIAVANFVKERHEFNAAKKSLNMARVALKKALKSGNGADIKAAQDKLTAAQNEYMKAKAKLHAAFQAKKAADLGIEEKKEETKSEEAVQAPAEQTVTAEENNAAVEKTITAEQTAAVQEDKQAVEAAVKATEYTKTNNGNGNGKKSFKIEKESDEDDKDDEDDRDDKEQKEKKDKEKSAPGKSGEAHGKAGKGNGNRK